MYVTVIEKRISAKIVDRGRSAEDWYALVAIVIPFVPTPGLEIRSKGETVIKLTRVVYNPDDASFWARVAPVLHPRPNAAAFARSLVDDEGWDIAMEESTLKAATATLHKKAVKKLQSLIQQARSRIVTAGAPMRIELNPRTIKRRH